MEKKIVLAGLMLFILVGGLIPFISADDYDVGGGFGINIVVGDPDWVNESNNGTIDLEDGASENEENDDDSNSGSGSNRRVVYVPSDTQVGTSKSKDNVQVEIIALNSDVVGVDNEEAKVIGDRNIILFAVVINFIELLLLVLLLIVYKKKKSKPSKEDDEMY